MGPINEIFHQMEAEIYRRQESVIKAVPGS